MYMDMKIKYLIVIFSLIFIYFTLNFIKPFFIHEEVHYDPEKAVAYSYEYITNRNLNYPNFENNCITFISQCLVAGGLKMDKINNIFPIKETKILSSNNRWFCYHFDTDKNKPLSFYLTSSFCNDTYFLNYWINVRKIPYFSYDYNENIIKVIHNNIQVGDVIIMYGKTVNHSALISKIDEHDIYYNSNTNDKKDYPLSLIDTNEYYKIGLLKFAQ